MRWALFVAAVAFIGCDSGAPRSHHGATGNRGEAGAIAGVYAIDWKDGVTKEQIDADEKQFGVDAEYNSIASSAEGLTLARAELWSDALLAKLRADPLIEGVEPVYEYHSLFAPNDPDFVRQWHMQQRRSDLLRRRRATM